MNGRANPKKFWEEKILTWEKGRYVERGSGGLLERMANRASNSLRFRLDVAAQLLAPHVEGKHVLELGCGSGIIAERIIDAGAQSYLGLDIAGNAIEAARRRQQEHGWPSSIRFEIGSITQMPTSGHDIVLSLGLLDWLTDEEIGTMFSRQGNADFLHAIAEKRPTSITQWIHRAYVHLAYGYRTRGYVPRYLNVRSIADHASGQGIQPCYVYRDSRLSFGALISSLSIGEKILP